MTRIKAGDVIELEAHRLDKGGVATSVHGGVAIRASGLLPGEWARVRLDHVGKGRRAYGHVLELIEPSPARRTPACPHHGLCGGCPLMMADEGHVAALKMRMLAELGIEVDRVVRDGRDVGYRWSAKRVFAREGPRGRLVAGSYRPGSHQLAPMRGCLVDHPDIAACFDELESAASEWAEADHLRYAWAKTNGAGDVLVTLVLDSADVPADDLAAQLKQPTGVASCVQDGDGNAMRGHTVRQLRGAGSIRIDLSGVSVEVGPLGFLQPNPPVAALAYRDLVGDGEGDLAFDLYAGAGVTTHLLRKRYAHVRACESSSESATRLGVTPQTAEAFLAAQPDLPDLIVANPPRAGLGADVCEAIVAMARRSARGLSLRVMSCEPYALARDLARLTQAGPFVLVGARAYDTLPQTAHVEVVVWLEAKKI